MVLSFREAWDCGLEIGLRISLTGKKNEGSGMQSRRSGDHDLERMRLIDSGGGRDMEAMQSVAAGVDVLRDLRICEKSEYSMCRNEA